MKNLYFIDLFAGIGGMRLAFENACKNNNIIPICVLTSEIKPYALEVYNKAFNENNPMIDITKYSEKQLSKVDFVLAGFPCQPFSYAGKGLGFADTRGTLFYDVLRFIQFHKPQGFVLENVEGLFSHDKGRTYETIIHLLKQEGYYINAKIINAIDFDIPQERKRIYICGSLKKDIDLSYMPLYGSKFDDIRDYGLKTINSPFTNKLVQYGQNNELQGKHIRDKRAGDNNIHSWDLELRGNTTTLEKNIMNYILLERRKKTLAKKYNIIWHDGMPVPLEHILQKFSTILESDIVFSLDNLIKNGYLLYKDKYGLKGYDIPTGNLSFPITHILDNNLPTNTIVATDVSRIGVIENDNQIRNLSTNECLKLFGYPIDWPLNVVNKQKQFDLIGNTICVPVVEFCCNNTIKSFI